MNKRMNRKLKKSFTAMVVLAVAGVSLIAPIDVMPASADSVTANQSLRIVSPYKGTWSTPTTNTNFGNTTDSPLLGNGDVGAVLVGNINA